MNLKRSLALALSLLMILSVIPVFGAGETLDRISGANRWATAVEISQEGWDSANTVVLANGRNYPDALAGVSLAYGLDAPILLTEADSLVAETKAEITRLGAAKVIILGGTGVISEDVEEELEDMYLEVERISGVDRFATAAAVAAKVAPAGADTVVLAYGRGYADALAAASYAAINGYPILLTEKNSLPEATEQAIEDLGATTIIVVGGTGVIAESAVDDLSGVDRVSGSNREATSVALAEHFGLQTSKYFLATGDGFADAITGAVLAAKQGTGILLVRSAFSSVTGDFFQEYNVGEAVIFGGTGVVSNTVANAAATKLVQYPSGIAGFVSGLESEGATVTIAGRTGVVDANGWYYIAGVAPGEHDVTVIQAGYDVYERTGVEVVANEITTADLSLGTNISGSDVSITGLVYDAETLAPVDADVLIEEWDADEKEWVEVATNDAALLGGMFTVTSPDLELDTEYRVTVHYGIDQDPFAAYASMSRMITTDANETGNSFAEPFALRPLKSLNISGTAMDKDGNDLADGVSVILYDGEDVLDTVTVTDGEYEFEDLTLPTGTYTIQVEAALAGNAVYSANVSVTEGSDRVHNIKRVAGYLVNFELGLNPLDAIFNAGDVTAEILQGKTVVGTATPFTAAGTENTTVFNFAELIAAGTYTVKVTGDYVVDGSFTITVTEDVTSFNGRVGLASVVSGTTDVGATVKLLTKAGAEVDEVDADGTGAYSFVGVADGEYKLVVSLADYDTETSDVFEVDYATSFDVTAPAVTLELTPTTGGFTGYVRTAGTMAYADDATVTFYVKEVTNETAGTLAGSDVVAAGVYTVTGLAPGKYTVVVRDEGVHENLVQEVTVVADDTDAVKHFLLGTGGNATLEVASLRDMRGAALTVASDVTGWTLTDAWDTAGEGEYSSADGTWADLPAGTYTLTGTAVSADHLNVSMTVQISKGANKELNITLADSLDVTARVYAGIFPGAPSDTATVRVFAGSEFVDDATVSGGSATFALAAGTYTFKYYQDGYFVEEVTKAISEDTTLGIVYLQAAE